MAAVNIPRFIPGRVGARSRRPIDKVLPGISMSDLIGAQQTQDLVEPNSACTVVGIRWSLSFRLVAGSATADAVIGWAIIILRDGRTANTMSFTGGANLYEPEQDVLAFGRLQLVDGTTGNQLYHVNDMTKTMRKLKVGDKITFIALGSANGNTEVRGTVQLFCKF